jgi:hypothetical protein
MKHGVEAIQKFPVDVQTLEIKLSVIDKTGTL